MKMKNLLPAIVLTAICVVVALVLGLTNALTSGEIEARRIEEINESLKIVAVDAETSSFYDVSDEDNYPDDEVISAKLAEIKVTVDKNVEEFELDGIVVYYDVVNGAYAVTVEKQGYASVISMTVGVDKDGKVIKAVVTSQQETHGKPGVNELPEQFAGKDANEIDDVEVITDATTSSTAIKGGAIDALCALGFATKSELPRTDAELIEYSKALIPDSSEFEDITPEGDDKNVKKVFREKSGKGYTVYVHTFALWGGTLESETIVAFDNLGNIVGINNIFWKVGHDADDDPPAPSADVVAAFFQSFVGKNINDIKSVELVTHATNTTSNVRDAVFAAADAVQDVSGNVQDNVFPLARFVGIMAIALSVAAIAAVIFIKRRRARK